MKIATQIYILTLGYFFLSTVVLAKEVKTYLWLVGNKQTGKQIVSEYNPHKFSINFSYNDRGRGPNITAIIQTDKQYTPTFLHASGHSYLGSPVEEQFTINGENISWESTSEQKQLSTTELLFYFPQAEIPQMSALLARHLLQKKEGIAALYPSGQASIKKIIQTTVDNGAEKKIVTLYHIKGVSLEPKSIWLDENLNLFSIDYGWSSLILSEWEGTLSRLKELNNEFMLLFYQEVSKQISEPLLPTITLHHGAIFNSDKQKFMKDHSIMIHQGKIKSIFKTPKNIQYNRQHFNLSGKYLLPGLWDMHAHIDGASDGPTTGLLNIATGVTSIRDMGSEHELMDQFKQQFFYNELIGPHIYGAGFIDKNSPFSAPTGKLVDTLAEGQAAIDWYHERNYKQIKLYSSIDPEWVKVLAKQAHNLGMRVSGHIPAFMNAEDAIHAGYDEITHLNMLYLNFSKEKPLDTRTMKRITGLIEEGYQLDLESNEVNQFIQLLKKKKIVIDPTLTIFESIITNFAKQMNPTFADIADHMPVSLQRKWLASRLPISVENQKTHIKTFQHMLKFIKKLHDAGISIVPGTDNLPGYSLHRELALYVEAGIPIAEVINLATIKAASIMKQEQHYGSLTIGKQADIMILDKNPLENIKHLNQVSAVIKQQTLFSTNKILAVLGIQPFVADAQYQ